MDPIEGMSASSGATGASTLSHFPPRGGYAAQAAGASRHAPGAPTRPAALPEEAKAEPVRPGIVGADGRFEKFILAVQALRLDHGTAASGAGQARTKEMRAAVREIFSIDGLPQAFPSVAATEPARPGPPQRASAAGSPPAVEAEHPARAPGARPPRAEAAGAPGDAPSTQWPQTPAAAEPAA
jgi:hypothetical protein